VTTLAPVSGSWKVVYTTPVGTRSVIVAFSIVRMYLGQVLRIPGHVGGASCLCANVVLAQDPACSQ
jgi:hypothetical protein